jgi:2-methylcitrate dehydratase PrpD
MQWGDPFHARLSAPYVAAVAVADRECGPDQFSVDRIADADLARYARENVEIVRDDSLGESGTAVELELSDGQVLRAAGVAPPGGPDSPLTLEDVKEKFLAAAERAQLDGWAPTALARLERIEEVPQIDADLVGSLP